MTIQTKHYIEPNDIVAFRFTCRRCGAALIVSISENMNVASVRVCPHCNEPWTADALKGSSMESILSDFVKAAKQLIATMGYRASIEGGFSIAMEIKTPSPPERVP